MEAKLVVQFAVTLLPRLTLHEYLLEAKPFTLHFRCLHDSQDIGLEFSLSDRDISICILQTRLTKLPGMVAPDPRLLSGLIYSTVLNITSSP